ncbi:14011_t:CDS:1, partial [Acaulospora morrowiae]
ITNENEPKLQDDLEDFANKLVKFGEKQKSLSEKIRNEENKACKIALEISNLDIDLEQQRRKIETFILK